MLLKHLFSVASYNHEVLHAFTMTVNSHSWTLFLNNTRKCARALAHHNLVVLNARTVDYDDTLNPDVAVEFSTAAMRFGHTQIPNLLPYTDFKYDTCATRRLENVR